MEALPLFGSEHIVARQCALAHARDRFRRPMLGLAVPDDASDLFFTSLLGRAAVSSGLLFRRFLGPHFARAIAGRGTEFIARDVLFARRIIVAGGNHDDREQGDLHSASVHCSFTNHTGRSEAAFFRGAAVARTFS